MAMPASVAVTPSTATLLMKKAASCHLPMRVVSPQSAAPVYLYTLQPRLGGSSTAGGLVARMVVGKLVGKLVGDKLGCLIRVDVMRSPGLSYSVAVG